MPLTSLFAIAVFMSVTGRGQLAPAALTAVDVVLPSAAPIAGTQRPTISTGRNVSAVSFEG